MLTDKKKLKLLMTGASKSNASKIDHVKYNIFVNIHKNIHKYS